MFGLRLIRISVVIRGDEGDSVIASASSSSDSEFNWLLLSCRRLRLLKIKFIGEISMLDGKRPKLSKVSKGLEEDIICDKSLSDILEFEYFLLIKKSS